MPDTDFGMILILPIKTPYDQDSTDSAGTTRWNKQYCWFQYQRHRADTDTDTEISNHDERINSR